MVSLGEQLFQEEVDGWVRDIRNASMLGHLGGRETVSCRTGFATNKMWVVKMDPHMMDIPTQYTTK